MLKNIKFKKFFLFLLNTLNNFAMDNNWKTTGNNDCKTMRQYNPLINVTFDKKKINQKEYRPEINYDNNSYIIKYCLNIEKLDILNILFLNLNLLIKNIDIFNSKNANHLKNIDLLKNDLIKDLENIKLSISKYNINNTDYTDLNRDIHFQTANVIQKYFTLFSFLLCNNKKFYDGYNIIELNPSTTQAILQELISTVILNTVCFVNGKHAYNTLQNNNKIKDSYLIYLIQLFTDIQLPKDDRAYQFLLSVSNGEEYAKYIFNEIIKGLVKIEQDKTNYNYKISNYIRDIKSAIEGNKFYKKMLQVFSLDLQFIINTLNSINPSDITNNNKQIKEIIVHLNICTQYILNNFTAVVVQDIKKGLLETSISTIYDLLIEMSKYNTKKNIDTSEFTNILLPKISDVEIFKTFWLLMTIILNENIEIVLKNTKQPITPNNIKEIIIYLQGKVFCSTDNNEQFNSPIPAFTWQYPFNLVVINDKKERSVIIHSGEKKTIIDKIKKKEEKYFETPEFKYLFKSIPVEKITEEMLLNKETVTVNNSKTININTIKLEINMKIFNNIGMFSIPNIYELLNNISPNIFKTDVRSYSFTNVNCKDIPILERWMSEFINKIEKQVINDKITLQMKLVEFNFSFQKDILHNIYFGIEEMLKIVFRIIRLKNSSDIGINNNTFNVIVNITCDENVKEFVTGLKKSFHPEEVNNIVKNNYKNDIIFIIKSDDTLKPTELKQDELFNDQNTSCNINYYLNMEKINK